MNSQVNYFIKNAGVFLLGSFGSKFLSFLLIPVYTSLLSTSEYGQIDIVTTTQSLLFPLVSLCLSEAIFRYVMNTQIDNKSVLSNGAIIEVLLFVCVCCIAFIINIFIEWEYMKWMLALLGSSMAYDYLLNYIKASQNSKKYVAVSILYTIINLIGNIFLLVVFKLAIQGFFLALFLSYLIPSIVIFFTEKIYGQIKSAYFDKVLAKRMLKYSVPLIFTALSWWIVTSSDRYMIRYYMSNGDVGVYSIASKIPLILQTLISVLQMVWQISTNKMHDEEPSKLKENYILFTNAFRQIGFISGSILIILTQPLMYLLAQNDFYEGWIYAPFLIISIVFSFATGMVASLYGAFERNTGVLYSVLVGGGTNIILNLFFIPAMGIMGATISTALSRLIIAIYRLKDTEKLLQFDRKYGVVTINCILIILQCVSLVYLKQFVYPIQLLFFAIICLYNREIFSKGSQYVFSILKSKNYV